MKPIDMDMLENKENWQSLHVMQNLKQKRRQKGLAEGSNFDHSGPKAMGVNTKF